MASRWDRGPDATPEKPGHGPGWHATAFPPRWSEAARALDDEATSTQRSLPAHVTESARDFRTGPRADGLAAAVSRGLRWLDAEVRGSAPSAAALLLGRRFQDSYAELLDVDHVYLPEEPVAYTLGTTLAGLLAMPQSSRGPTPLVVMAGSVPALRRQTTAAWCRRLGLRLAMVDDPGNVPADAAAVVVETPNASGLLENLAAWRAAAGPANPLIVCSLDPLCFFTSDLRIGSFADVIIFDVAALATSGDESAAVGVSDPWASKIAGLYVDEHGDQRRLVRSDGVPVHDEPAWTPVFVTALLAAELGPAGFRRRARAVAQRRRWLETFLERRGIAVALNAGNRFRESRFEVPRWVSRRELATADKFRLEEPADNQGGTVLVRCPLTARRRDVVRLGEVLAGG